MANHPETRPCVECDGIMDRRHGTLPMPQSGKPVGPHRIPDAHVGEIGVYYRCLKNGAHTVIVERDPQPRSARRD